jgi:hypothetical protein
MENRNCAVIGGSVVGGLAVGVGGFISNFGTPHLQSGVIFTIPGMQLRRKLALCFSTNKYQFCEQAIVSRRRRTTHKAHCS